LLRRWAQSLELPIASAGLVQYGARLHGPFLCHGRFCFALGTGLAQGRYRRGTCCVRL